MSDHGKAAARSARRKLAPELQPPTPGVQMDMFLVTRVVMGEMPNGDAAIYINFHGTECRAGYQFSPMGYLNAGDPVLVLYDSSRRVILFRLMGMNYPRTAY